MISSIKTIRLPKANNQLTKVLAGLSITIASLYAPTLNAAPIYKVVDEQSGQVTFTDRPQSYEQEGDKQVVQTNVTTGNNSINSASQATSNQSSNNQQSGVKSATNSAEESSQVNYQLAILEPSKERAYHRPAQSIDIRLQLQPALQTGDSVSIYLNGNEIARGLAASIATIDLVPGQYNIQAVVKDKNGQVLQQVQRSVFVIQNTVSIQNKRKAAAQLQAYQNLPWHQKVLLKLRQSDGAKP